MSITATCLNCSYTFPSMLQSMFGGGINVTLSGNKEVCPNCGQWADVESGEFRVVDGILTAFSAPGVTREKVEEFANVARAVDGGEISTEEAAVLIERISGALSVLWKLLENQGTAISIILTIIGIYLSVTSGWDDDIAADKQLKATTMQTAEIRSSALIQQKIFEELRKQREGADVQVSPVQVGSPTSSPSQTRKPTVEASGNRHERRRANTVSRRSTSKLKL